MAWISVVGWAEHQHYKDRNPPWIKLHTKLLDNYEWARLQDASKLHLMGIWLLAARHENRIPADPEWIARRISATEPVDLQALVDGGFISVEGSLAQDASTALAKCSPETEAETETELLFTGGELSTLTQPEHVAAYEHYFGLARVKVAYVAEVRAVAVGMPGHGPGFGWPVVGQALHEMAAAGAPFSAQALRGFARKVRDRKPERPKIQTVTDDLGRDVPGIKQPDGSWQYLTPAEAKALGWEGAA